MDEVSRFPTEIEWKIMSNKEYPKEYKDFWENLSIEEIKELTPTQKEIDELKKNWERYVTNKSKKVIKEENN
jgi:hypothetical protein